MQLVESSSDTHYTRCAAKGHCLISLAFELKHGIRNPFAHQQIEVEKDDANHVVAYRLQDAPVEALGSRLGVFAGLVNAWRQVDHQAVTACV